MTSKLNKYRNIWRKKMFRVGREIWKKDQTHIEAKNFIGKRAAMNSAHRTGKHQPMTTNHSKCQTKPIGFRSPSFLLHSHIS